MKGRVLALTGGVGGAKLALGLARILPAEQLVIAVNTGDDFRHLGLEISPDLDTLVYTLADLADPVQGWGRKEETWHFIAALERLGGETWFRLGDADLAMHVERTRRLAAGESLTEISNDFARRLGVGNAIVPMSNDPVRTRVSTNMGWLDFQSYFVRNRCEPVVYSLEYAGAESAQPAAKLLDALADAELRAIILCPSNPFLSIAPMLAMPAVKRGLADAKAPVIAVSPIIGGQAVKGPTAKMMRELGLPVTNAAIASYYRGLIDALIVDLRDGEMADANIEVVATQTLMTTLDDRKRLAETVLATADRLRGKSRRK